MISGKSDVSGSEDLGHSNLFDVLPARASADLGVCTPGDRKHFTYKVSSPLHQDCSKSMLHLRPNLSLPPAPCPSLWGCRGGSYPLLLEASLG